MTVRVGGAARYSQVSFATSTVALQSLLNGGQKEVILGEGTYTLDAGLSVPSGVILRGDGAQATTLAYNSGGSITDFLTLASGARVEGIRLVRTGAGGVTNGVATSGNDAVIRDMILEVMAINVAHACCRIEGNRISGSPDGIIDSGDLNQILHNVISDCVRGIHLTGALRALVEGNDIAGNATSIRGIHADGAADFCKVLHNTIKDIQLGAPGRGIDWEASGASNLIQGNVFSGTFGTKAILADPSVPATTQFVGNLTIGVSPPGARLVAADLGGATGFANT
jgi:hypothetical protein